MGNRETRASGDRLHSLRRGPESGHRGTRYEAGHNIDWLRKITVARVSDPADGMLGSRCSADPAWAGSAPVGPSSAGPGRTLFGPTSRPRSGEFTSPWRHKAAATKCQPQEPALSATKGRRYWQQPGPLTRPPPSATLSPRKGKTGFGGTRRATSTRTWLTPSDPDSPNAVVSRSRRQRPGRSLAGFRSHRISL